MRREGVLGKGEFRGKHWTVKLPDYFLNITRLPGVTPQRSFPTLPSFSFVESIRPLRRFIHFKRNKRYSWQNRQSLFNPLAENRDTSRLVQPFWPVF
jgi:hypothetical protein